MIITIGLFAKYSEYQCHILYAYYKSTVAIDLFRKSNTLEKIFLSDCMQDIFLLSQKLISSLLNLKKKMCLNFKHNKT